MFRLVPKNDDGTVQKKKSNDSDKQEGLEYDESLFEKISINIAGVFPITDRGNKYILVANRSIGRGICSGKPRSRYCG